MCTPKMFLPAEAINPFSNIARGINAVSQVSSVISNYKTNKDNLDYRTQLALNNAKIAENEALRQKQLGIEQSRMEKITGLNEANKIKARNSASNLDLMSDTSLFAYRDALNKAKNKANFVKNEYDLQAKDYFAKANNYLNQASDYNKQYNQSLFDFSMNSLGGINQVASDWYENRKDKI